MEYYDDPHLHLQDYFHSSPFLRCWLLVARPSILPLNSHFLSSPRQLPIHDSRPDSYRETIHDHNWLSPPSMDQTPPFFCALFYLNVHECKTQAIPGQLIFLVWRFLPCRKNHECFQACSHGDANPRSLAYVDHPSHPHISHSPVVKIFFCSSLYS